METAHRRTGLFDDELARLWRSPAPVAEDTEPTASVPHGRQRDEADLDVDEAAVPTARGTRRWLAAPVVVAVGLLLALALGTDWLRIRLDDMRYGQPRTTHLTAFVGHNDGDGVPTHLMAVNMNRRITIIEMPGSDPARARIIAGPYLVGKDEDLTPATLRVLDVNADGHSDLLVRVKNEEVVYINDKGEFRLMTRSERPTVERTLGGVK